MEEKVILKSINEADKTNLWKYNRKYAFSRESGAGNNWAFGYIFFKNRFFFKFLLSIIILFFFKGTNVLVKK